MWVERRGSGRAAGAGAGGTGRAGGRGGRGHAGDERGGGEGGRGLMARRGREHRPAFALPMVVLLTLVAAVTLTVILERQAADALTVRRQIGNYEAQHVARGLGEILETWVNS